MNEPQGKKTDTAFWDGVWEEYGQLTPKSAEKNFRQNTLISLLKTLNLPVKATILEVGIGPGVILFQMAQELQLEPWGLDISFPACRMAHRYAIANAIDAKIVVGDMFSPPWPTHYFDVVLSQGVIEHFSQPIVALSACDRLVKPGGYLVTTVPNIAGFIGEWMKKNNADIYAKHTPISIKDLDKMYHQMNYEVNVCRTLGSLCIPYYERHKNFFMWGLTGVLRRIRQKAEWFFTLQSKYYAPELLIIGKRP